MKKNQFLEICKEYDDLLASDGVTIKLKEPFVEFFDSDISHIRWMLNEIPKMIEDPCKLEKCNRWLGFIQGVLWIKHYYTIEDMKAHTQSHKENLEEKYDQIRNEQFYYLFEGGVSELGE